MNGNPELQLYAQWLKQVKPGRDADRHRQYAWAAAALWVQKMIELGPKPTRRALLALIAQGHERTPATGCSPGRTSAAGELSDCTSVVQVQGGVRALRAGRRPHLPLRRRPLEHQGQEGGEGYTQ